MVNYRAKSYGRNINKKKRGRNLKILEKMSNYGEERWKKEQRNYKKQKKKEKDKCQCK